MVTISFPSNIEAYFKLETKINVDLEAILRGDLIKNENRLADIHEKLLFFETVKENNIVSQFVGKTLGMTRQKAQFNV